MKSSTTAIIVIVLIIVIGICVWAVMGGQKGSEEEVTMPEEEVPTEEAPTEEVTGAQNDAGSGGDVSADVESPYRIESGTKYNGTLDENDDGDVYTVNYNPGDVACIKAIPSSGLDIMLACAEFDANDGVKGEEENLCVGSDIEKTDLARIDIMIAAVNGTGNYTLEVTMTPQNDGNSGGDAGAAFEIPVKLEPGTYSDCRLGYGDGSDTYKVSLAPGQTATIKAIPSSDLDILFNRGGSIDNIGVKGEEEIIVIESKGDAIDLYDFGVEAAGGSREPGTYTLEVSVK